MVSRSFSRSKLEHFFRFVRDFYRLWLVGWCAVEVIDLFGDLNGVRQLFASVFFQFLGNVVVFRAFHRLAVNDVGDDGLVFAREIFV